MKYLGKFTGKLYSLEEKHNDLILECALQLSDDETKNEEYLSERRANDREAYLAKLRPKNPIPGRIL